MSTTIKHVDAAIPAAESFVPRHVGPDEKDVAEMLKTLGQPSLDALIDATIPRKIRVREGLNLPKGMTELEVLTYFRALAARNQVFRSFIGMGYSDCVTPPVIQRNIIENPGWYTAYTPYQAEIAQGRLEALLNFQTMVIDLTGLEIANASLLDEGTADHMFIASVSSRSRVATSLSRRSGRGASTRTIPSNSSTRLRSNKSGITQTTIWSPRSLALAISRSRSRVTPG